MQNPITGTFHPIDQELFEKFQCDPSKLTKTERKQRNWTRFEVGEELTLKGVKFTVARIEPTSLLLRPIIREWD